MTNTLPTALVLAAGLGTRLRPLTLCRAKAAVPVAGVPLICRHLKRLTEQGVDDVVINLHHRPDTIAAVVGDGCSLGCRVRFSWERVALGSAGGPRHALPLLGQRFILLNADTLCNVNLEALLDTHLSRGASVTLAVTKNPAPHHYGGVLIDANGWVKEFAKAGDKRQSWHFVGTQVAEASVFETLADGKPASSIGGLYDRLLAHGRQVATHPIAKRFFDIGTPGDYLATTHAVSAAEGRPLLSVGARTSVHPTAHVKRSVLWDDVVIGADCVVTDCVICDGVHLPRGSVLTGQAVVRVPPIREYLSPETDATREGELLTIAIKSRMLKSPDANAGGHP